MEITYNGKYKKTTLLFYALLLLVYLILFCAYTITVFLSKDFFSILGCIFANIIFYQIFFKTFWGDFFLSSMTYKLTSSDLIMCSFFKKITEYSWDKITEVSVCELHPSKLGESGIDLSIRIVIGTEKDGPSNPHHKKDLFGVSKWRKIQYSYKHKKQLIILPYTAEYYNQIKEWYPAEIRDYRSDNWKILKLGEELYDKTAIKNITSPVFSEKIRRCWKKKPWYDNPGAVSMSYFGFFLCTIASIGSLYLIYCYIQTHDYPYIFMLSLNFLFFSIVGIFCFIEIVDFKRKYKLATNGFTIYYAPFIKKFFTWESVTAISVCDVYPRTPGDHVMLETVIRIVIGNEPDGPSTPRPNVSTYAKEKWRGQIYTEFRLHRIILIEYTPERLEEIASLSGMEIQNYHTTLKF